MNLDAESIEALAEALAPKVAARLAAQPARGDGSLVTAATLAQVLGVSRAFVYEHADALGAVRLGQGPKAPLRFDVEAAKAAHSRSCSEESDRPEMQATAGAPGRGRKGRRRRLPNDLPAPGSVLRSGPSVGARR